MYGIFINAITPSNSNHLNVIAQDKDLPEKDKAKALKQVQSLAEAAQNPNDEDKKDIAEQAVAMLERIVAGLPSIAASAKAVTELLPLITQIFWL